MQACNNNNNKDKLNDFFFQFTREPCPCIHTEGDVSKTEKCGNLVRIDVCEMENIGLVGSLFIYWYMARCFCKEVIEKNLK